MKTLALALLLLGLQAEALKRNYEVSAFTSANVLHFTMMGDCNHFSGRLRVTDNCHADRATRNLAIECNAELEVISTQMGCPEIARRPVVISVDLHDAKVAPEARVLNLQYQAQTMRLEINK